MNTIHTGARTSSIADDGRMLKVKEFRNVRGARYAEIFLIEDSPSSAGERRGQVYNTTGLNDAERTGDSAPQALVGKIDIQGLKRKYGTVGAFLNGPRQWTLDWIHVPSGVERDFDGLKAAWVALVAIPRGMDLKERGATAYKPTTVERKTDFGFDKGKALFILDDSAGNTWIMKSMGLIVDPNQRFEELEALGERLKLPPGWKFRVAVPDRELILKPESGVAGIVQDDLGNTYDLSGPGYGNFTP